MTRDTRGLKPIIINGIYGRVIEKITLYGCNIWYKNNKIQKQKISQLQESALIAKRYKEIATESISLIVLRYFIIQKNENIFIIRKKIT